MKYNEFKFSSSSEAQFLQTHSPFHVHQSQKIQLALKSAI